jgi:hypothetical protein
VTGQLTGRTPDPFPFAGEDWFEVNGTAGPNWPEVLATLVSRQEALAKAVADIGAGRAKSSLAEAERFDLVLGITCHAIYHAGQIQLIKRLLET